MIEINIGKNIKEEILYLELRGHAKYAEYGKDIVCAAASVLTINLVNSIEKFTSDKYELKIDEDKGYFFIKFISCSDKTKLLIDSCVLGLFDINKQYTNKYINIKIKEVK